MKSYPEIVQNARNRARNFGMPIVVYQNVETHKYDTTNKAYFDNYVVGEEPVIRLLLCMPNGSVVQ